MKAIIEQVQVSEVAAGDLIRFTPDSRGRAWWRVAARNEHHIVAIRQAAFHPKGTVEYTVTGHLEGQYNGAGPGPVRSSLNTLGGGWDLSNGREKEGAEEILSALEFGQFQLSMRRIVSVSGIERKVGAS